MTERTLSDVPVAVASLDLKGDVTRDDSCNDDFQRNTALQGWNNVVTIRNNVATMFQGCVALKIVVANRFV